MDRGPTRAALRRLRRTEVRPLELPSEHPVAPSGTVLAGTAFVENHHLTPDEREL